MGFRAWCMFWNERNKCDRLQENPAIVLFPEITEKRRQIEINKAGTQSAEYQVAFRGFKRIKFGLLVFLMITSCVKKPARVVEDRSAIAAELIQIDSMLSQSHVKNYAKAKTIIRMAAGESAGESNYKAIGQVVRKFVDIIQNPSIAMLMQNPLIWFDALLEWEVAYKSFNRMNEDDYLTLLESSGEADFFWSMTANKWTSSWEHLLLALAWEQGENRDFAVYEAMQISPEDFGNNEFSVIACWLTYVKMSDWGYPQYAKTFLNSAKEIIESSTFRYTGKTRVSWLGTTREQARTELLFDNELIGLIGAMNSSVTEMELSNQANLIKQKMETRPTSGISEIFIIADFMIAQVLPDYEEMPESGKFRMMTKMTQQQDKRKIHKVMFGAYLATWIWETFLDRQIISGMHNMPMQTFKLLNTLGSVKENVLN